MFRGLISDIEGRSKRDIVKASFCQFILYILHFSRSPILIFKINFAISAFGNFLRNVQLKWFNFNHSSHTSESVFMAIIFWQTRQNHFELFSCPKVSNILPTQNPHNTFFLIIFISDLIRDERYVYCYLHIFHLSWDLIWYWHQASTFPFFASTLFSICFAVDVETTHSKSVFLFLHFLIWWTRQSNFSGGFSWSLLKMEDLQLPKLHILVFFFSKTRKSMNMPISPSKKEHFFQEWKAVSSL